jgi:hypothetical protein
MSDFEYSTDALNAKNAFFRVDTIIYVEGDDDIPFWHEIFSNLQEFKFKIEPRGGSTDLDKYINLIENGDLNAIAARDSDYLDFTQNTSKSKKVVYTIGYSIENTLYTPSAVHALTKQWCKTPTLPYTSCSDWVKKFSSEIAPLVVQDIANFKAKAGLQVMHDNCSQFMSSRTSYSLCPQKIGKKVDELQEKLPKDVIHETTISIGDDPDKVIRSIRGHFWASVVARFISKQAQTLNKKISLSGDGLYTSAMTYFSGHFKDGHPHFKYYLRNAKAARDALAP